MPMYQEWSFLELFVPPGLVHLYDTVDESGM